MSNQIVISSGAKVRNLDGVLTASTGVVSSVGYGLPNGVATLDGSGKIPVTQLPNSVMEFKGVWNAATNTPTLADGTGNAGDVYLCNVAGTVNFGSGPIYFAVGDYAVYTCTVWARSSGATGTVTSVAVTESGDALSITGSPITTSGTINIGFAGTSAQYVAGDGSLITFPALTGYVPYTGATSDVDLGTFSLNAKSLHIKGVGGNGHLGLKHQSATPTGSANESLLFADVNGNFGWQNDNLYLTTLSTHANTANRTYTFPNASGTVALTTDLANFTANSPLSYSGGVLSISQANTSTNGYLSSADWNTFNNKQNALGFIPINGSGSINYISKFTGSTTISQSGIYEGVTNYVSIGNTNTTYNLDVTGTFRLTSNAIFGGTLGNGTYTYTLPSATGTLALTSQLSSYVPYTGATADVNLGANNFKANTLSIPSAGGSNQITSFANTTSLHSGSAGLNVFGFNGSNNIYFGKGLSNGGVILWTNSQVRYYTLPDADGTLALTSDLSSYVPTTRTISTTAPLQGGGDLSANRTLSITQATTSTNGYLSSTDWNTFNGKQAQINGTGFVKASGTTISYDNTSYLPLTGGTLTGALNGTSATFSTFLGVGGSQQRDPSGSRSLTISGVSSGFAASLDLYATRSYAIYTGGSGSLGFYDLTANAERLTIASTGAATFSSSITAGGLITGNGAGFIVNTTGTYKVVTNTNSTLGYLLRSGTWKGTAENNLAVAAETGYGLNFYTNGTADERISITTSGNVGIGTSTPGFKFTVSSAVNSYLFNSDNSRNVSGDLNALLTLGNNCNNTSSYYLVCSVTAGDRMYIYGNGNIVNSNGSYGTLSDVNLKENIVNATPKLADILQLKVRNFNLIGEETKQIGFIAQEFEEVFPSMVDIDGKTGMKTIKTSVLTPMHTMAIQELYSLIQEQQKQIEELKAKIK